ncbi:hypothetical protein EV702DRAFT_644763 [Suillus placidus]|uniref:Uncharacterized protein n=1 Tax=Suillus placidus TaxID=48579 RepID=A0A9P7A284_9AGAM|nr:hypothetical protein EV702DRAFT_644763 [Suillus placidus]
MNRRHVLNFTIVMTLLIRAVLLCVPFVFASLPSFNDTSTHTLDASNCPSCNTRTLWNILLSCGLTLFACTWTAIHPNIPGMDEGKLAITSRRLCIMVIALIAPELMITWATRQFLSAREAANAFNDEFCADRAKTHGDDRDTSEGTVTLVNDISGASESSGAPRHAEFKGWTITHGFFAWMGGFMLYVDGKPRATLTPDELRCFVRDGSVDMPVISEAEIEDRSKGDGLSKGIAILQLAWFVAQLVARYIQNLPITLLEIDTLAVAALTCIPYGLWWKKPKGVGCPYIVHLKATASLPDQLTYDNADILPHYPSDGYCSYFRRIKLYLVYPFLSLMGIIVRISPRAARSRRVPSLGGYKQTWNRPHASEIVLLTGCFSGMVFGGIHCLGWNYFFHRHTEDILWRTTSLGVICAPVVISLDTLSYMRYWKNLKIFGLPLGLIASLIYITARVTLIVLMILSLRSLPTGVYDTVAWTRFIPHL